MDALRAERQERPIAPELGSGGPDARSPHNPLHPKDWQRRIGLVSSIDLESMTIALSPAAATGCPCIPPGVTGSGGRRHSTRMAALVWLSWL